MYSCCSDVGALIWDNGFTKNHGTKAFVNLVKWDTDKCVWIFMYTMLYGMITKGQIPPNIFLPQKSHWTDRHVWAWFAGQVGSEPCCWSDSFPLEEGRGWCQDNDGRETSARVCGHYEEWHTWLGHPRCKWVSNLTVFTVCVSVRVSRLIVTRLKCSATRLEQVNFLLAPCQPSA